MFHGTPFSGLPPITREGAAKLQMSIIMETICALWRCSGHMINRDRKEHT